MLVLSSIIIILATVGGILNLAKYHSIFLGNFSLILIIIVSGIQFGIYFFPKISRLARTIFGSLVAISLIMCFGSFFYYFAYLDNRAFYFILISIPALALFIGILNKKRMKKYKDGAEESANGSMEKKKPSSRLMTQLFLYFAIAVSFFLIIRMFWRGQTVFSIRSPWEALNWQFFLIFFLAAVALIILAYFKKRSLLLIAPFFFFIFFSVTTFIYPLGYGFDPFVHQTTENYIADNGTITPKPFFYIGQYSLVTFAGKVSALPIVSIDRYLLPVILAVFFPAALWIAAKSHLAVILTPMLPIATFAATTPQGLASALALIIIFIAIGTRDQTKHSLAALWIMAFAVLLTHPIAGISLVVFLFIWTLIRFKNLAGAAAAARTALIVLSGIAGSVIIPALFIAYGIINGYGSGLRPDGLSRVPSVIFDSFSSLFNFTSRFNMRLDFVYFYNFNLPLLLIAGAAFTIFFYLRKNKKSGRWILIFPVMSLIAVVNAILLLAAIDFSFLPLYEQADYAERLFGIAELFLLPPFIAGLAHGAEFIIERSRPIVKFGVIIFLAGLLAAGLYLTYPRNDSYVVGHGWSVGQADITAVRAIAEMSGNEPYIVLSNQSVSAAALAEFGFKNYFPFKNKDGKIETAFYYPIPTGGPLYRYFLEMSYKEPNKKIIGEAMSGSGVKLGYFVVNSYWTRSEKIIEAAKSEADDWKSIDSGKVHIFKFTAKK